MRNGVRVGILGLIVAAAICPGVAVAADFKVTTTADGDDKECLLDCTLREAVVLAGQRDQVVLPAANYMLADGELASTTTRSSARTRARLHRRRRSRGAPGDRGAVAGVERDDPQRQRRGRDPRRARRRHLHPQRLACASNTHGDAATPASTGGGMARRQVAQLIGVTVSGNTASTGRLTRGGGIARRHGRASSRQLDGERQHGGRRGRRTLRRAAASTRAGVSRSSLDDRRQLGRRGRRLYVVASRRSGHDPQISLLSHGTGGACGGPGIGA